MATVFGFNFCSNIKLTLVNNRCKDFDVNLTKRAAII